MRAGSGGRLQRGDSASQAEQQRCTGPPAAAAHRTLRPPEGLRVPAARLVRNFAKRRGSCHRREARRRGAAPASRSGRRCPRPFPIPLHGIPSRSIPLRAMPAPDVAPSGSAHAPLPAPSRRSSGGGGGHRPVRLPAVGKSVPTSPAPQLSLRAAPRRAPSRGSPAFLGTYRPAQRGAAGTGPAARPEEPRWTEGRLQYVLFREALHHPP